ncbi:MAG: hypothetical protein O3A00_14450 [Planctomycetota bacterium]|nr:hypothetical protein [Planctomycetota bacterium]
MELAALLLLLLVAGPTIAADHHEGFDTDRPTWQARYDQRRVRVVSHRRHPFIYVHGRSSEYMEFDVRPSEQRVRVEHVLPPARVIEDLVGQVWVRSNRPGWTVKLRVVFPHQRDPRTRAVLSTYIVGDASTKIGEWQLLKCDQVGTRVRDQIVRLRAVLNEPFLDKRDLYVDRIVVDASLLPGPSEVLLDELRISPMIPAGKTAPVQQVAGEEPQQQRPIEFRLDQLMTNGQPIFPRIMPYHGESSDVLRESGINVAMIPDYRDRAVVARLRKDGLWLTATPPRARAGDGTVLGERAASLLPFGAETDGILFWYLGTRITSNLQGELAAWAEQIQSADRADRPLAGDVMSSERVFSRNLQMLSVSRHFLNTTFSLQDYRDWIEQKRKLALPGTFFWTWIQTEPTSANVRRRRDAGQIPIVIEPELIRLQAYAALSAGCRGIGYWKTSRLDSEQPGAEERRLMLNILNAELEILGSWLATGRGVQHVAIHNGPEQSREEVERFSLPNLLGGFRDDRPKATPQRQTQELQAAVIHCEKGRILLPMWLQKNAQFVPGQMSLEQATMIVPGVPASASAWEITTTGIRSLGRERATGGIRVTVSDLDQVAAIVISSDRMAVEELRIKARKTEQPTSRLWIELAKAKRERVLAVNRQLDSLGVGIRDADRLAAQSSLSIRQAESAVARLDYNAARIHARQALRMLRILQRAHWLKAANRHSSPISSPHLVCFQTLPDHWRMVSAIGRSSMRLDANLLRSGGFEDFDTMVVEGWQHAQNIIDGVRASAELKRDRTAKEGKSTLRLVAGVEPDRETPKFIEHSPIVVTTPPVNLQSGQIVHVSGWIKLNTPVISSQDGIMIYDSILGPLGAIRWRDASDWQRFEMIREVQRSGPFTLTLSLNGLGEVQLDDLRIVPHTPQNQPARISEQSPSSPSLRQNLLNRLQRLNPLP